MTMKKVNSTTKKTEENRDKYTGTDSLLRAGIDVARAGQAERAHTLLARVVILDLLDTYVLLGDPSMRWARLTHVYLPLALRQ